MAEDAEPLILIPKEKWPSILEIYQVKGDPTAKPVIKHQILTKKQFPQYDVLIYAPFGQIDQGIVLAWKTLLKNTTWREFSILSTKIEPLVLMKALKETKIINWESHKLILNSLMPNVYRPVANFLRTNEKVQHVLHAGNLYCLDAKREPFNTKHAYNDVDIYKIGEKFAGEINETWKYRNPGSEQHIRKMLIRRHGIGIVGKRDGELRGCIFVGVMGELHCLYIKEEYRRRGYARLLIKLMCNKLWESGLEVTVFIAPENKPSISLFLSIGFKFHSNVKWITCNTGDLWL